MAMNFSLYDATLPSYLQVVGAVAGLLRKAEAFCAERGLGADTLIQARLADDMLPFAYQVKETAVHSLGALEGVRRGVFSPDETPPPGDWAALHQRIADTLAGLNGFSRDEVAEFVGRPMRVVLPARELTFTAENFLLSFSQPNFYFHATTVYDLLRSRAVPLGKRDFLGRLRIERAASR
jgi:hypothetical protein